MDRGRFITLEGGEGAGKTTQIAHLAETLRAAGLEVLTTREPGGSPGAEEIRALLVTGETGRWDPLCEALLHYAARRDHWRRTIAPALTQGTWVLCDRFADSTMAYQAYGMELGRETVARLHRLVLNGVAPDLTLILDLPVEEGLGRAGTRMDAQAQAQDQGRAQSTSEDRYERMGGPFHERLRQAFLDIARREPDRCAVIDASADEDAVAEKIAAAVTRHFKIAMQ